MSKFYVAAAFILMTLLGAMGSYYLKCATGRSSGLVRLAMSKWFMLGGVLYFVSALLNIYLLRFIPYVVFLPLTAITYVWSMLLARVFLRERITAFKVVGIVTIFCGIVCLVLP